MEQDKQKQIEKLKKFAEDKYGIKDTQIIDFEAFVDGTLTYSENLNILEEQFKTLGTLNPTKKDIKEETTLQQHFDFEQTKLEEQNAQKEFKNSIKEIKENKIKVLENLYFIPKEYIKSVASGFSNSLILLGKQGLGKSFLTLQTLNELKTDFVYYAGFTSPLALYKYLYENRQKGKVVIFDDTYGIISQPQALCLMLSALYSSTAKRKIMWNSTTAKLDKAPNEFIYEANTIFIINELPKTLASQLIKSRCLCYEFRFNRQEILEIMYAIAQTQHPKLSKEERIEIVNFIKNNSDETMDFELRLQQKVENLYLYSKEKWKELSLPLLTRDERLYLIKKFLDESISIQEAQKKWCEVTGNHRATFFRLKERLEVAKSHS